MVSRGGPDGELQYNHHDYRPWGSMGDFAVHASVYGKVQAGPSVDIRGQIEGRRGKRLVLLPKLGCLATYIGY
jgi:hypothetical protein